MNYDTIKKELRRADQLALDGELEEGYVLIRSLLKQGCTQNDVIVNLSPAALKALGEYAKKRDEENADRGIAAAEQALADREEQY